MAVACPVDLDTGRLRQEIQAIYARVATDPSGGFHFHRGPVYAAERLGYEASALAAIPEWATASFAGVANPLRMAALAPGRHRGRHRVRRWHGSDAGGERGRAGWQGDWDRHDRTHGGAGPSRG